MIIARNMSDICCPFYTSDYNDKPRVSSCVEEGPRTKELYPISPA